MSRIVELSTFVGEWSDSLRNNVVVWDAGRGIQVSLTKADRSGKEILLTIKKNRSGIGFVCGHYDLDEQESTSSKIVWRDNRFRERITVWTRKGSEHQDRDRRDREHRDREHRDRERGDREYRDRDHPDRAYGDREHRDRDSRGEHRDREQRDRDSDGHRGPHGDRDPQRPADEPRPRRRLPSPPKRRPPPGDLGPSQPQEGATSTEVKRETSSVKREAPQETLPSWQPVPQQQSPFDAKPSGAAPPPWSSGLLPGPPAATAPGPPGSWAPAPWASPAAAAAGQAPLPGPAPVPSVVPPAMLPPPPRVNHGQMPLAAPMQPVNHAWAPQPMPADNYYASTAGVGRPPSSMGLPPSRAADNSDLTQVLTALAAAAGGASASSPGYSATPSMATPMQPGQGGRPAPASPLSDATEAPSGDEKEKASRPWRHGNKTVAPAPRVVAPGTLPGVGPHSTLPMVPPPPGMAPGMFHGFGPAAHPNAFGMAPPAPGIGRMAPPAPGIGMFDPQSAGWNEVLDLLAAATSNVPAARTTAEVPAGQIDELFSPFGLPQAAPAEAPPSEEVREQVLAETLARLLREKVSTEATAPRVVPPPPKALTDASSLQSELASVEETEDADLPDWARKSKVGGSPGKAAPMLPGKAAPMVRAPMKAVQGINIEQPLDKFIRVFGLDELAAKCLRALEDDEAAFVIEACQGRLRHAKNPSAVVMTSIKSVAARVGRRYWGNREQASDLESLLAAAGMGNSTGRRQNSGTQLQMFEGDEPPSASASPEVDAEVEGECEEEYEEEEEEEDEAAKDEPIEEAEAAVSDPFQVEAAESDPYSAMLALEAEADPYEAEEAGEPAESEPDAKRRRTDDSAVVEVDDEAEADNPSGVIECLEAEASPEPEDEAEDVDDEDGNLFFVDTGGQ